MSIPFVAGNIIKQSQESFARTADGNGNREFQMQANMGSAPLCDEYGRLIVRTAGSGGLTAAGTTAGNEIGRVVEAGSAPDKDNVGLVQSARCMQRADFYVPGTFDGSPYVTRMFGWVQAAGWVQLIMKDESAGANPPVLNDVPEVAIPVAATGIGAQFNFADYRLVTQTNEDLATYIAFSTTAPTYTPGGANLWFYFLGFL